MAALCHICSLSARHKCIVCKRKCCVTHLQALRSEGIVYPSTEHFCTECFENLMDSHGTETCYKCPYLTNSKCAVCKQACCQEHSLVEHVPSKEHMEAGTLNKTQICDACAGKKYLMKRGGLVGVLVILLFFIIFFPAKYS